MQQLGVSKVPSPTAVVRHDVRGAHEVVKGRHISVPTLMESLKAQQAGRRPCTGDCPFPLPVDGPRQVLTKAAQDGDARYARELLSMSSRSVTLAVASDARLGIVLGIISGDWSGVWLRATLGSWLGTSVGIHDSASARRGETGTGSRRWLWARAGVRSHSWARAGRNALGDSSVGPSWGAFEGIPIEFLG
jgi:hypothetical protein